MESDKLIQFDMEKKTDNEPSIIMVVGVGGAGGNAVNHMCDLGIKNVRFMVCNTDRQALQRSRVSTRVQMGEGLGAGNKPEKGRAAAIESLEAVCEVFRVEETKMVFITAGMGGGTGTGAAPVIAKAAQDMGILTVGIVTMPYLSEGPVRNKNAKEGVEELRKHVDSLLIINNENIQEIYGELPLTEAFSRANDILATAAKGIAETITLGGDINVDFADVETVMKDSGIAIMGSARANGEDRAMKVAKLALSSPLLNHNSLAGATNVLFNITFGTEEVKLGESIEILNYLQTEAGKSANIIWGANQDIALGDALELIVIATGFKMTEEKQTLTPLRPIRRGSKEHWSPPSNPFDVPGLVRSELDDKVYSTAKAIEVKRNKRYDNIDHIFNTPAHIRRKVRLVDIATSQRTRTQDSLAKTEAENDLQNSLFEQPNPKQDDL